MSEYEVLRDLSSQEVLNEAHNATQELHHRLVKARRSEAALVDALAGTVNAYFADTGAEPSVSVSGRAADRGRKVLEKVEGDLAAGFHFARNELEGILADDAKYPQLRLHDVTRLRIERALKLLD